MRGPISYLDFYLQLSRTERSYRAQVLSSPAGEASSDFIAPFSELELENFVLRIGRPRRGTRRIGSPEMEALKTLGKGLYDAVLSGDVRACWSTSVREAEAQNAGLRLRLRIADAPELNDVPWEYLYNSNLNRFLSLSEYTPLIRFLDLPERIRPLPVDARLEILVMISSPTDYPGLDIENEWSRLNEALAGPVGSGQVRLRRLPEARLTVLQRELRRGEYHILHFIGHAGFDREAQGGVLVLCDDTGKGRRVTAENLGFLLHDHRSLRLVVLNACEGSRASRADPFAGVAQTLVQQGVPAVIAMQFEITDQAAITFAEEFYASVADGHPVDAALADARKAIFGTGNDIEWGTPVLYLRAPDGLLFSVNRDALATRKLAEEVRQAEEAERRAEAARQTEETEQRAEAARQTEETERRAEAARQAEEAKRRAEATRRAEEAKRQAEAARQAEKAKRRAEAARQAEEVKRQAEAARQAEEAKRRAEAARQAEEVKRQAEAARRAEKARRAEEARQRAEAARQRAEEARQQRQAVWEQRKKRVIALANKVAIPAVGIVLLSVIAGSLAFILLQPPATGTLSLDVTPANAALTLDGMAIGSATGQEVLTGPHVIEITAAGYLSKRETLMIPAGGEQTLEIALERLPPLPTTGTLRLEATPTDAALTLDGTEMGSANDFRQELSAGTHLVEISAAGYQSISETVTIAAGGEQPMEIALARLPASPATGTLKLDVTPAEAVLALDGTEMGSANDFRQELSAGTHLVEITAAGYQSRSDTITIAAGGEQPMEIALARLPAPPTTGTLVLDVMTPGAVLILDGKRIGLARGFRRELPAGVHQVKIVARGYHTATKTLTLTGGDLMRLPFKLVRSPPKYSPPVPPPPVAQPLPPPAAPRRCFLFFCG